MEDVVKKIIWLILTGLFVSYIHSQTYISTYMDEIIVSDKVEKQGVEFSQKEVEKAKNFYLPDILKYEPGINVTRRAIIGDNADMLSIRGLSGNRILLNLNGRSLNAAGVVGGYYNDFSVIPFDRIEKIQVIKGGGDLKYGNNALGGVINIITKKPKKVFESSIFSGFSVSKDIDYIYTTRISASQKIGKFGYSIGGSWQKADEFLWNNDYEAKNIGGGFFIDMPYESKLSLQIQYTNTERGFIRNNRKSNNPTSSLFYQKLNEDYPLAFGDTLNPYGGNISQPGPGAYWIKEKTLFDISYEIPLNVWYAEFKFYKNIENRFEYNYSSHITSSTYPSPDGTLVFKRKVESDRSWGGNLDISKEFEKNVLNAGFEYKYLGYGDIKVYYVDMSYGCSGVSCVGGPASQSADVYAFYLKNEYGFSDKFKFIAGLRYDDYNVNEENDSGIKGFNENLLSISGGLNYEISEKQKINFNAYSKYRTPTMPEVYWHANNQFGYTKGLKSEKNNAVEANYMAKFSENIIELSVYNYDIDNYIMFRIEPNKRGVYNIDNVNIKGASFGWRSISGKLKPYLNFTVQRTRKGNDFYDPQKLTKELDYVPKFKLNAGLETKLTERLVLNMNYRYNDISKTIYLWKQGSTTYFKLINIKSYDVVDVEFKYNYKNLTASVYADNIFNEIYEEKFGYPMSSRIIGGSVSYRF